MTILECQKFKKELLIGRIKKVNFNIIDQISLASAEF